MGHTFAIPQVLLTKITKNTYEQTKPRIVAASLHLGQLNFSLLDWLLNKYSPWSEGFHIFWKLFSYSGSWSVFNLSHFLAPSKLIFLYKYVYPTLVCLPLFVLDMEMKQINFYSSRLRLILELNNSIKILCRISQRLRSWSKKEWTNQLWFSLPF